MRQEYELSKLKVKRRGPLPAFRDAAQQVADDAETEKRLVRRDVVGRRGRVPAHDQSAGNIDETEGGDDYKQ